MTIRSDVHLRVYPNPYAAIDHRGMPSGAVRHDPDHGIKGVVHFVGATLHKTHAVDKNTGAVARRDKMKDGRGSRFDVTARFDLTEQPIVHSDFHIARIRDGELIPANEDTAKRARVPFIDPVQALAAAKAKAIAEYKAAYCKEPPVADWPAFKICDSAVSAPPLPEILAAVVDQFGGDAEVRALAGAALAAAGSPQNAASALSRLVVALRPAEGSLIDAIAEVLVLEPADRAEVVPAQAAGLVAHLAKLAKTPTADALRAALNVPAARGEE